MKRLALLFPLVLAACQPPGALAPAGAPDLVVRYREGLPAGERAALRARYGVSAVDALTPEGERWRLPTGAEAAAMLAALATEPALEFSQPNRTRRLQLAPGALSLPRFVLGVTPERRVSAFSDDPHISRQWYLDRSSLPDVWPVTTGAGVTVAVIDSGVDPNHPDLKANLLPMIDEVKAMGNPDKLNGEDYADRDGHGHGTHVCGIVGAVTNNGIGIAGSAPGVKLLPIKVTSASGDADDATITRGIVDAVDKGARIINLSIGGPDPSDILLDALNYAFQRNVAVVIAAGNDGRSVNYPAAYDGVISVGAITDGNQVASYSSHGDSLVMVAPGGGAPGRNEGQGIYSTTPQYPVYITVFDRKTNDYSYLAGTSMAAPQVTAAAAMLLSREPNLTPAQLRTRLAATSDDAGPVGYDPNFGYGALNAEQALNSGTNDGRRP